MTNQAYATVPNQRVLTINKEPCNKENKYSVNNLSALDEAARRLNTKAGFKLYIYLAKNQDKFSFALSSQDFCYWSGCGRTAYRSAFEELEKEGYLIKSLDQENRYTFYDKSRIEEENIIIDIPNDKVEEVSSFRF